MDTKMLAASLLVGHLIAVVLSLLVIFKQVRILRRRPDPTLKSGRVALFILAVAVTLGNFIPIAVDLAVLAGGYGRTEPSAIGIAYALSNVLTLISSAVALLILYIIAGRLADKGLK